MAIPTPNPIKNVLDGVAASVLFPIFRWVFQALAAQGVLKPYEVLDEQLLVGLDGTDYFRPPRFTATNAPTAPTGMVR